MRINGASIELEHYASAHTDSDISVNYTEAEVFQTGDTWWNGYYPFIDYSTGGSIDGMIQATEANLAKVTDEMVLIPGHGPISNKSELTQYRDLLVDMRDRVAALKRQGRTIEEIIASKPGAAHDDKWGGGFMSPSVFAGLVYEGV